MSSVTVLYFSKRYLGTEKAKNVRFGTKVAPCMRIMCALIFLEKVLIVAKLATNNKNRLKTTKNSTFFSPC